MTRNDGTRRAELAGQQHDGHMERGEHRIQDDSSAMLDVAAADEWKRANGPLYDEKILARALADAEAQRPISVHTYVVDIRQHDRVDRCGRPVKINDHFGAVWARELWRDYPHLRKWLRIRRSEKLDALFGIRSDHWGVVGEADRG